MTFETEETQGKFHELPAQTQLEYCSLEIALAREGKQLHVAGVLKDEEGRLQVVIRIDQKL
jgi:hypothetical protein